MLVLELCSETILSLSYKMRGKVWPIVGINFYANIIISVCMFINLIMCFGHNTDRYLRLRLLVSY